MESNTWAHWDMEFRFLCSTWYLMSEHSKWVRYWVEHKKRNSISPSNHVLFFLLYKHLTFWPVTRRSWLNSHFKKRMHCHTFMVQRVSVVPVADRPSQIYMKIIVIFHVWWKSLWNTVYIKKWFIQWILWSTLWKTEATFMKQNLRFIRALIWP